MKFVSVVVLLTVMTVAKSTLETVDHGAQHGKQAHTVEGHHNVHFDHEAILGSYKLEREFDELPPEEAKKRLGLLVMKMDKNGDHIVSKDELVEWIIMSFRLLDEEEALEDFDEKDGDDDEKLMWTEFLHNHFGYTEQEFEDMKTDNKEDITSFLEEVEEERKKFVAADVNEDGVLDKTEYVAFYSPFNYPHMHHVELERTMISHDKNKDGALTLEEFLSNSQHDKEWEIVERERFEEFDVDKDGLLSLEELRPWVLADTREEAQEEAEHLIQEADTDGNGELAEEEIINAHEEFVGSQATDYGRHLHFVKHRDEL